jgi:hypothetical protein
MATRSFATTRFITASALHHHDILTVEPCSRDAGSDIGLVLMICGQDFDRTAEHRAAEILDRHLYCDDGAGAGNVGEGAGDIGQDADADRLAGLRAGRLRRKRTDRECQCR